MNNTYSNTPDTIRHNATCVHDSSIKGTDHAIAYLDSLPADVVYYLINDPSIQDDVRPNQEGIRLTDRLVHRYEGHLAIVSTKNRFVTAAGESIVAGTFPIDNVDEEVYWSTRRQIRVFKHYPLIEDWVREAIANGPREIDDDSDEYENEYVIVTVDMPSSTIIDVTVKDSAPRTELTVEELSAYISHMLPEVHKGLVKELIERVQTEGAQGLPFSLM